jgi:cytochrome oxidase Cu insertion factor (SCO1/SenC/PrrC family)
MDPQTDTPERLKAWGKEYGVRPGWTLLTGELSTMSDFLKSTTGDSAGKTEMHSISVIIWDDQTKVWKTTSGVNDSKSLMSIIEEVGKHRVNRLNDKKHSQELMM